MPLRILELGKQFRPATSIIYPPFKNGRYMEEYFYDYVMKHKNEIESDRVYIPIFWTNLQNHPGFNEKKKSYEILLSSAISKLSKDTKYFTIIQHDDGIQLKITADILVFGACGGDIPLPLIYEDSHNTLLNSVRAEDKIWLASFIGSNTHPLRLNMYNTLLKKSDIFMKVQGVWTATISENLAELFVENTKKSKFCLAPRGYGRSSFRFFEAMLLDIVPVYFWDDIEWLPYKDVLDYSKFTISIQQKDIPRTYDILKSISNEKYLSMIDELKRVRHYFTLEGMSKYIIERIKQ